MPIDITRFNKETDVGKLAALMSAKLADLEAQINGKPELHVNSSDTIPTGAKTNDFLATIAKGDIMRLGIPTGKGKRRLLKIEDLGGPFQAPLPTSLNLKGLTVSAALPSVTEYPNSGDYGIHNNTTAPGFFYLALNNAGVIEYSNMYADGTFHTTNFVGLTTTAAQATLTEYPNNKDWGFHRNTAPAAGHSELNFCYNRGGTLHVNPFDMVELPFINTQFLGKTVTAANATLTEYPNANDWGFHNNTALGTIRLVYNQAGTIKTVLLA